MSTNIDWPSIKAGYESGISQRTLAREYGVSQPAISHRAHKEGWIVSPFISPHDNIISDNNADNPDNSDNVLKIIATLLKKVAEHADAANLEPKDIKLLADAISQFHKIKLTTPDDKPTASGLPADLLKYFSMEQLNRYSEIEAEQEEIVEAVKAQKLEAEQGIKTIRKQEKI